MTGRYGGYTQATSLPYRATILLGPVVSGGGDILRGSCRFLSFVNNRGRRSTPPLSRFIVVWSSSYWSDAELYPRRGTFFAVVCVARAGLHQRRKSMCPKRTSWLCSCGGLGMGGASGGPERREGDGVGCIVIDMALGCGTPLGRPKTIAVIFLSTRWFCWNIELGVADPGQVMSVASDSSLLFLLVVVHFVHSLAFTRYFWVRTARLVNHPASFE
jgi:hypothetical protein